MERILLLSYLPDLHDDALARSMRKRGINVDRCVFMEAKERSFSCDLSGLHWQIIVNGNVFNSENVSTVWMRSLAPVHLHDSDPRKYLENIECANAFNEFVLALPQDLFACKPSVADASKSKRKQIGMALASGLNVPKTKIFLSSNLYFIETAHVLKSTIGGVWGQLGKTKYTVPTTRASDLSKRSTDLFGILQDEIYATSDIRLFLIGDEAIAFRIWSAQERSTSPDYRFHEVDKLNIERVELPQRLMVKMRSFARSLDIEVAAIDLLEGVDEEYYFLEANVVGNWLWYENFSGVSVTEVIVDYISQCALKG